MKTNPKGAAFLLAGALALAGCQGSKGAAGNSCTVHDNGNGSSTISCTDGTSATVTNGTNGANGQSCAVTSNGDGTRTITCPDGSTVTVTNAVVDYALMSDAEKADSNPSAVVTSVTIPADGQPVVNLKVSDRKGYGIKNLSPLSTAAGITWRFGLVKLVPGSASALGVNGAGIDTWVNYLANNATSQSAGTESPASTSTPGATNGTLTDNGDGSYSYRFAKVITNAAAAGTTYDANATHRVVVLISSGSTASPPLNPFAPVNAYKDFIPATNEDVSGKNDKVDPGACLECHSAFRAKPGGAGAFHNGTRYDVHVCVACHNDQRRFSSTGTVVSEPTITGSDATGWTWTGTASVLNGEAIINLPVFIHKIHMGEDLKMTGGLYAGIQKPYEVTFPQDVRNCVKCHRNVAQADNWKNKPSRRACGACHDNVSFLATAQVPPGRTQHQGGAYSDDSACLMCHGGTGSELVADVHVPVVPPDANNIYNTPAGGNSNTNAAYVAAAGAVPPGAHSISYDVKTVTTVTDTSVTPNVNRPQIVFKLKMDGADVNFGTYDPVSNKEIIPGFVGSPSVYFAWAQPQDGITAPADFNVSASGYIRNIWNGTGTCSNAIDTTTTRTGAGTISGPDGSGYYTITLTCAIVPDNATMLTGGVGYTYSLGGLASTFNPPQASTYDFINNTQPLTQIDLPAPYTYTVNLSGYGGQGGLIVPAADVWKTGVNAAGVAFAARRTVVDTAKCNQCHAALGVNPTFHAGQRNNAPTCSFCHTPNRTSSGWAAHVKYFVHAIHASGKRTVQFTWDASTATHGFYDVTYPGILNNCEQCHVPGTYDFSAAASANALPNDLVTTVGTGKYNGASSTAYTLSPYVIQDNVTDYGAGFSTSGTAKTGSQGGVACTATAPCTCTVTAPCEAADTTLVISPIMAACSACHDSAIAIDHMQTNGGSFYAPRSAARNTPEQCLLCHGPGKIAAIADVHK